MKVKVLFFIIAAYFMMTCSAYAEPYRLAVYGDSLSAGYRLQPQDAFYTQLEEALKKRGYDVVVLNYSRSGETTWGGLQRLPSLISQKPNAVILELGINDAIQNVALDSTERNLKEIIIRLQENKIPVLLVGMKSVPTRIPTYQQEFEQMYQGLAQQYNLVFYPFFMKGIIDTFLGQAIVPSANFLSDNMHPSPQGIRIMVENILPTVERFLKKNGV